MCNYIIAPALLLFALWLGTTQASAQETTLDIKAPPTGSLSTEQLGLIAADIRRLEAHPYASDAKDANQKLFIWIVDSPDITISMCPGVISDLVESESASRPTLVAQFTLSTAAWIIENQDDADDIAKVNLGGLEGMLNTYKVMKEVEGNKAKNTFAEKMLKLQKKGELEEFVEEGVEGCGE